MKHQDIINRLKSLANAKNVAGMAHYGINPEGTLGVSMPAIRSLAKEVGRDQALAEALFDSGIHEARILAGLVAEPRRFTSDLMERWVLAFDSWDVCDQICMNLFDRTPYAYDKACQWAERKEEFVKRAGFAIMASLAVHDKKAADDKFLPFLALIEQESGDDRNFVRKAVNWALRQIGKRNAALNRLAIAASERILQSGTKSGHWIASDALRELTSPRMKEKVSRKKKGS